MGEREYSLQIRELMQRSKEGESNLPSVVDIDRTINSILNTLRLMNLFDSTKIPVHRLNDVQMRTLDDVMAENFYVWCDETQRYEQMTEEDEETLDQIQLPLWETEALNFAFPPTEVQKMNQMVRFLVQKLKRGKFNEVQYVRKLMEASGYPYNHIKSRFERVSDEKKGLMRIFKDKKMVNFFEETQGERSLAQAAEICPIHELTNFTWIYYYFQRLGHGIGRVEFLDEMARVEGLYWDSEIKEYVTDKRKILPKYDKN